MRLYLKILLAFTVVILISVAAVALAAGRLVESEFRVYNALYSNRTQKLAQDLLNYYNTQGSWDGVQNQVTELTIAGRGPGQGQGKGKIGNPALNESWTYQLADVDGQIIANASGENAGFLNRSEKESALHLTVDGNIVGYLVLNNRTPLEEPAEDFIASIQRALWFGVVIAFATALLVAGFLARGFTAPIRKLTRAAEMISAGELDSRAQVSGQDEIAQLANSFNTMATSLQQAEYQRESQTADIAHELRNPLAILQGTLEALADGVYQPTLENIRPALDQVQTLNRLIEDLRILALADAGGLRLEKQPVDFKKFIERIVDAYKDSFAEQAIDIECSFSGDRLHTHADFDRLTQVINNILGNALHYVPSGGKVCVDAREEMQSILVSVIDNGPGVHPDELSHLFERFWRGDPSRSRETGGSGLGLAIAEQIIHAHNGRIWAEETPGGGLTVRFTLPVA
jgi:two-component system sensor histidine kinase BaeS